MANAISNFSHKLQPINKREVEEFGLLVLEAQFFAENKQAVTHSNNFPPALVAVLGSVGAGTIGVAAVFATFTGMSGAEIMGSLASFGFAGAVGGITSIVAVVAAPMIVVGGSIYYVANQNKLGKQLKKILESSYINEELLATDDRGVVIELLMGLSAYRDRILKRHPSLKRDV